MNTSFHASRTQVPRPKATSIHASTGMATSSSVASWGSAGTGVSIVIGASVSRSLGLCYNITYRRLRHGPQHRRGGQRYVGAFFSIPLLSMGADDIAEVFVHVFLPDALG